MKTNQCLVWLILWTPFSSLFAQSFHQKLHQNYELFKESSIQNRRFKHSDIVPLIQQRQPHPLFEVTQLGRSMEERAIYLIKVGTGKTKVLLWSQMHGDEPTATMAIMDMFNFFAQKEDVFDKKRQYLLNNLTLYFIPMLNPDGAERFQRRNPLGIDLNRDALRLQTPEAQILKKVRDQTNANWGFNLHDQSRYYTSGISENTATISFLAPAYNYEKSVNTVRSNAMKLIVSMNEVLQQYIPNKVAKYSDDFEPRAFGDNIQKWGTSTILIESGGLNDDLEKQNIRQMNFVALMAAFDAIAQQTYEHKKIEDYFTIPDNDRYLHDLLIREATIIKYNKPYTIDVAFKNREINTPDARSFYLQASISDMGDLTTFYAYKELNAKGMTIIPATVFPKTFNSTEEIMQEDLMNLLRKGYGYIKVEEEVKATNHKDLPIQFIHPTEPISNAIYIGGNPTFFLEKDGKKIYAVVNGKVFRL